MIKTLADQYLAQNAGRRYPFKDDTALPDCLSDAAVLDFRCTVQGVPAGTVVEARLTGAERAQGGSAQLTVTLTASGEGLDTLRFQIPGNVAAEAPYTAYAAGERAYAALTVTAAALPPYDAEVECLRVDAAGPYIVIDDVAYCDAVGTYYAFTVSRDGVVTHDLIPVRRGNTGYMYDRITNRRFGNAGAGDFAYGLDVVPVEHIESHGTEYIDTGVTSGPSNLEFTIDCTITNVLGTSEPYWPGSGVVSTGGLYYMLEPRGIRTGGGDVTSCIPYTSGERVQIRTYYDEQNRRNVQVGDRYYRGSAYNAAAANLCLLRMAQLAKQRGLFFGATVSQGGALVRRFIPVRVGSGSTWEGAAMDVLTRRIYRNRGTGAFGYGNDVPPPAMDVPFAATTVVCDSLKVHSLRSCDENARDRDADSAGLDVNAPLAGKIVLAEGRNAEPYLDGNRLHVDITRGGGLGEFCQTVDAGQNCGNVMFTINGERPGTDGDIRIVGEDGISVTPIPEEHAVEIRMGGDAERRTAVPCSPACG